MEAYIIGLIIIFVAAYSQYVFSESDLITKMLIVYGIPILVVSFLWGQEILKKALIHMSTALKFCLGYFGIFTVIGTFLSIAIFFIIITLDPAATNLLNRPNPVLHVQPEFAWIMAFISILIIGPAEEYLFRGFIYGGLLSIFKNHHWFDLAIVSSILFAAAHLYYAYVYGIDSLVQFTDIATFGMTMAMTYYLSGGNLFMPAMIHGVYDATGFIGIATTPGIGIILRNAMVLLGIVVAVWFFPKRKHRSSAYYHRDSY